MRYPWRYFGYKTGKNSYPGKLGKLPLLPWAFAIGGIIGWKMFDLAGANLPDLLMNLVVCIELPSEGFDKLIFDLLISGSFRGSQENTRQTL